MPSPERPECIGLCLSGGGYRAAAFHLGAIAYLHHLGLDDRVEVLSTVSGGTFTGARWALSRVDHEPFEAFMRDWYTRLDEAPIVPASLDKLGGAPPAVPSRRDVLITATAQTYAEHLFADGAGVPRRFGELLDSEQGPAEIVFNATEFRFGRAFRFQKSKTGLIGNGQLSITPQDAARLRIADIAAASSCFPGGFEPLAFPNDFHWPDDEIPTEVRRAIDPTGRGQPVALMDGGVYDNQGLESLLLADRRLGQALDLVVVSDTDAQFDDLYAFPEARPRSRLDLAALDLISRAVMLAATLIFAASLASLLQAWRTETLGWLHGLTGFGALVISALLFALVFWGRRRLISLFHEVPKVGIAAARDVGRLKLSTVEDMVRLRLSSLQAMAGSVFMRRTRSLGYEVFYRNADYAKKRVSNLIYNLTGTKKLHFDDRSDEVPAPTHLVRRYAEVARAVPTSLWWEDDAPWQAASLVATGQATLCYNLLKWVDRRRSDAGGELSPSLAALWDQLLADWRRFVEQPDWLASQQLDRPLPRPPEQDPEAT